MSESDRILEETVGQPFWSVAAVDALREQYQELENSLAGLTSLKEWTGVAGERAQKEVAALRLTIARRLESLNTVKEQVSAANAALVTASQGHDDLPDSWIERTVEDVTEWVLNEDRFQDAAQINAALKSALTAPAAALDRLDVGYTVSPDDVDDPDGLIPVIEPWDGGDVGTYGYSTPGDYRASAHYVAPTVQATSGAGGLELAPGGGSSWQPTPWEPTPWEPTPWEPAPGGPDGVVPGGPDGVVPGGSTEWGGRDQYGGDVSIDDGSTGYFPGGYGPGSDGLGGGTSGSGMGLAGGLAGGALGAGALGAAGAAAMRGGLGGAGGLAGLVGLGGAGGAGGAGLGGGVGAGAGMARGLAGGLAGGGSAAGGVGGAGGAGGSAGGAGQGGRGGMMGGGMGGGGAAGKDKKGQRRGAGGLIAPSLDDDPDFVPQSESAQAGGRGENGA